MEKSEYSLLHVYPQPSSRHPVRIVGNTVGLLTLVTAIIEATSIAGRGSDEAFCNNAEAFEIQVVRVTKSPDITGHPLTTQIICDAEPTTSEGCPVMSRKNLRDDSEEAWEVLELPYSD